MTGNDCSLQITPNAPKDSVNIGGTNIDSFHVPKVRMDRSKHCDKCRQKTTKSTSFMNSEALVHKFSPSALSSELSQEKFSTSVHY